MKKIVSLVFILLLNMNACFANYFDDNSNKFISYASNPQYKEYLDLDSIQVLRYDPPYYIITAETYIFDYVHNLGIKYVNKYFYDYNTKVISWQMVGMFRCDEDGNIGNGGFLPEQKNFDIYLKDYSPGYHAAELAFQKSYNIPFR